MSERRSDYFTTMPGPDVVDQALLLEHRVSSKALESALREHHELLTAQATDLDQMYNRRPPAGSLACHELLDRVASRTEELEEVAARIAYLQAYVAHLLELAHQQANQRVAAEILAWRPPSDHDEEPQGTSGSLAIRER